MKKKSLETEYDYTLEQERRGKTKSEFKMLNWVLRLFENPSFKSELKEIRREFKIPKEGFKKEYTSVKEGYKILVNPNITTDKFNKRIISFAKKHGVFEGMANGWIQVINHAVLYNDANPDDIYFDHGMIEAVDISTLLEPTFPEHGESDVDVVNFLKRYTKGRPIAILINPYAKETDILDFVRKTYKTGIKSLLATHEIKNVGLNKIRRKNERVEKRDAFIYEHRDIPNKELKELVNNEFGDTVDHSYLNKIKRTEKEKRK